MKYKIEIELSDEDARNIQATAAANEMTWNEFAKHSMIAIAETHSGSNIKI